MRCLPLKSQIAYFVASAFFLLLAGCYPGAWNKYPPPTPTQAGVVLGAASGAVLGGAIPLSIAIAGVWGAAIGGIIEGHQSLVEELQYNGVQVLLVGEKIKLILPSDSFFYYKSPHLNPAFLPILNRVAFFIRFFPKIEVEVAGYTDCMDSWQRNLELSRLQAQIITAYLWRADIDARLIFALGYGEDYPIAPNSVGRGRIYNRRIEISFYKIDDVDD